MVGLGIGREEQTTEAGWGEVFRGRMKVVLWRGSVGFGFS